MMASTRQQGLSLTRVFALFATLLTVTPRVGCMSAPGQPLAFCPSALISIVVNSPQEACDEGPRCSCCERRDNEPSQCPTSGKPCKAFVYMGSSAPPSDPVSAPAPLECVELVVVTDDASVVSPLDSLHGERFFKGRCSSLIGMGQLLRV
jgi:hypothetical protein